MLSRSLSVKSTFGRVFVRAYSTTAANEQKHKIVIIGAGTGGLAVASTLAKHNEGGLIIDPASHHFYQPGWTMVGAGIFDKESTKKEITPLIPSKFKHLKQEVIQVHPDNNYLITKDNTKIYYDYLVVAAGIQINWDSVKGLKDALGKDGVVTNYSYDITDKTWEQIKKFKGGNAIFTQPVTPIKCAGAPQKIMYLAEENFAERGIRDNTNVKFFTGAGAIFGVKKYADSLTDVCKQRNISTHFQNNLVEIRPSSKEAVFKTPDGKDHVESYDFIHVTPPMGPPTFLKTSKLADSTLGWVDVDKEKLQHVRYPNVFAVGDCNSAPKSRTAAAISREAPVVSGNLLDKINGKELSHRYTGYASCPLVTGKGKLILAEFDYNGPNETFGRVLDQSKESRLLYHLKKDVLPLLYWHGLLKGYWNSITSSKVKA